MAWRLAGSYVLYCDCRHVCPCACDQQPTGPDGKCHLAAVWGVREGNLDDVDLSRVNYALLFYLPSNPSAGNWKQGLVIDEGASDEQVDALERIMTGKEGGPMADLAAFVSEWLGVERASVTFSDGEAATASVHGDEVSFEPFRGRDGRPTTVGNALFGFAPTFMIGKASGRYRLFGDDFDANYGEVADFEFSSEQ